MNMTAIAKDLYRLEAGSEAVVTIERVTKSRWQYAIDGQVGARRYPSRVKACDAALAALFAIQGPLEFIAPAEPATEEPAEEVTEEPMPELVNLANKPAPAVSYPIRLRATSQFLDRLARVFDAEPTRTNSELAYRHKTVIEVRDDAELVELYQALTGPELAEMGSGRQAEFLKNQIMSEVEEVNPALVATGQA